jgi:hypothetical protein
MHKRNRKCGSYCQMGKLHDVKTDNRLDGYSVNSTTHLQSLIDAHAYWIDEFMNAGWDGYLFSMTFNNLPGSRATKIIQMTQEVTRLYGRLATRMVRKPRSSRWAGYLPIGLFLPDLPVPKTKQGSKSTTADVSINDGLHMHGVVLANRWGRVQVPLDEYFEENGGEYLTRKIQTIDVQRITHDPDYVVGYALKGLVKRSATADDVLVLDWGSGYLRPNRFSKWTRRSPEAVAFLKHATCCREQQSAN